MRGGLLGGFVPGARPGEAHGPEIHPVLGVKMSILPRAPRRLTAGLVASEQLRDCCHLTSMIGFILSIDALLLPILNPTVASSERISKLKFDAKQNSIRKKI